MFLSPAFSTASLAVWGGPVHFIKKKGKFVMYKNPRILKLLDIVNKANEPTNKVQDNSSKLPKKVEMQQDNAENIIPVDLTIPMKFSDSDSNVIQPGSYILQEDCSLLLEKNEPKIICGTPSDIIICNNRLIRNRSPSSSTDSISILINTGLSATSDIFNNFLEHELITDTQVTPVNNSVLSPSNTSLNTLHNDKISSVYDHTSINQVNTPNSIIALPLIENPVESDTIPSSAVLPNYQNDTTEHNIPISQGHRQKKRQPQNWITNKNKAQREKGEAYLGKKKVDNKWIFVEPRNERKMKNRCNCKLSSKGNTKLQCNEIPEEERKYCFDNFWNMNWNEKKVYIRMLSVCKLKQRERCAGTTSRRENSVELYLSDRKGKRYRVCKNMFLNTFCVGEWVIKKWVIRSDLPKNMPKNNSKPEQQKQLHSFFNSLAKVESHYRRQNTSKQYLEPLWTSKSELYRTYKNDFCPREKSEPLSITSFSNQFEKLNLALFRPKNDLCEICESFKTGNIQESEFKIHDDMKKEARESLKKDTASNNEVLTMDLQSVLLSPRSNVSALYYRTKLIVHNFTIYDVKRNQGYCYIWNESEGKLTSNEFSTIIITALGKFIKKYPISDDQELIMYSDGCTYQNRNVVLSNALLNFSMQNKINIVQKFLEKGHTQMECDSMHSVIERAIRNKKINVPADYAYLAKTACKKNPYEVDYLYHHFFKDIENNITFYKSIRPGKKTGDPTVTNLRALKYVPDGKIVYKLRHSSTVWEELPIRVKKLAFVQWDNIPQLYSSRLKIKKDKYLDLQALKSTMEKDYHKFYDDLPHF